MPDGPTLYATLMNKALPNDTADFIERALHDAERQLIPGVRHALESAYAEGVRDGFQQGVAAETARASSSAAYPDGDSDGQRAADGAGPAEPSTPAKNQNQGPEGDR